jgi:hypothetical protein
MSRTDALNQVKMYQANDWEVVEETPEYFLLKKNTGTAVGHILLIVFFWWTFGLANLLYWALSNKKKKVVK